jgi:UDP-glucose 4-epimerase
VAPHARLFFWSDKSTKTRVSRLYHITSGTAVSFGEVVELIKERLPQADISIAKGPLLFADGTLSVKKGALSIDRARAELGYTPRFDIRRGLHSWIDLMLEGKG